ncbi:uncharacterized protein LOC111026168 [Momordica charantia]|uniref:Uncharacterized protein LOC111026168 n=1 Tax=Momordica charantia TaxID=3673 RepID=A0A6J1BP49_MOMCH|nr:uncharacterized protein LOC111026168 [Momordica charantia]XP_022159888.1 uncharacterized protein LOC111026168 [Momordica charantia]
MLSIQFGISFSSKVFVIMPHRDLPKNPKERENVISVGGIMAWNAFDNVTATTKTPEALMAEINAAISKIEYARTTACLESATPPASQDGGSGASLMPQYDARMADEAYKAGCAALAVGKLDDALHSLNVSLSKCPPEKTSAVAKLLSLITLTSQQLHRSSNCSEISED